MENPRLEMTSRGLTVFDKRYLYSKKDPQRRPSAAAEAAPKESRCLYLLPSPLLGYGMEKILENIPLNSHILAFEVSQDLFKLCCAQVSKTILRHSQVSFVRLSNKQSLEKMLNDLGPWRFRKTIRINLNAGTQNEKTLYDSLCDFAVEFQAAYWRNRHSLRLLGRNWIKHIYANLLHFSPNSTLKTDQRPLIVIGAGCSLESILDFLKTHQEQLNIWVTDTALGTLLAANITPDLICVLETQAWNHLDFHGSSGRGIPILADLSSYPNSIASSSGECFFYSSHFTKLKFLERLYEFCKNIIRIPPLGSVGLAAVYLALNHNTGPVFLAGLDFSFIPGKTHARGSSMHRWQLAAISRTQALPGWYACMRRGRSTIEDADGNHLSSDKVLSTYAELFCSRFGGNTRLYQLAGSARLGVSRISLDEAEKMLPRSAAAAGEKSAVREVRRENADENRDFLLSEKQLLEKVIHAWDRYAQGSGDAETVVDALSGLDHIYCDFPDEPPLPKNDDVFLVRAVKRSRDLHRYITRLLEK